MSTIHSSLDGKLSNVLTQLSGIENRIVSLESRQTTLKQEVRHYSTSSSSPEEAVGTTNFAPALTLSMNYCVFM